MSKTEFELDFSRSPVYEVGAALISLLALPQGDEKAWGNLMASLCHLALKGQYFLDDTEPISAQAIKPDYAFRSDDEIHRDLKKLERLLRDRIAAGQMAVPLLAKAAGDRALELPRDIKALSLNELSKLAARDLKQSAEEGNLE